MSVVAPNFAANLGLFLQELCAAGLETLINQSFIRVSLRRYSAFTDADDTLAKSRNFQPKPVEKIR